MPLWVGMGECFESISKKFEYPQGLEIKYPDTNSPISPQGITLCWVREKESRDCGYLVFFPSAPQNDLICHECLHVLNSYIRDFSLPTLIGSDEPAAYLMQWIYITIQKFRDEYVRGFPF